VLRRDVEVGGVDESKRIEVSLEKGVGVAFRLASDSGSLSDAGLSIEALDEDELRAVLGPDPGAHSMTTNESLDVLGQLTDQRKVRLQPGMPDRRVRLRKGHYRLAILDESGTIEPDAIDVSGEGEAFVIRWTPK
jgi:hypothetical protein